MIAHKRLNCARVLVSCLLLTRPAFAGESRERLVATARDGNQAAILSIHSMECKYERKPWGGTSAEKASEYWNLFSPGRFWRSGEDYRHFKPNGDRTTTDALIRNGRGLFLRKGPQFPRPLLGYQTLTPVYGVGGFMWRWLSFSHWGPVPISFYPFHEILNHPHVIRAAERLPPPASEIHIELTHDRGRLEFWFDPKVNYLVRKSVMIPPDTTYRWEDEVIEFAEPSPSVFVPVVVEHRCLIEGVLQATIRTTLTELKVNQPLAKNALRLPGIEGMECTDAERETKYKVDADGNR